MSEINTDLIILKVLGIVFSFNSFIFNFKICYLLLDIIGYKDVE